MDEMYGSIDPLLKERARINLLMYLQRLIDINEIALQDDHYSKV